jgi:hypothetical protein
MAICAHQRKAITLSGGYLKIALSLSQSDALNCLPSCLDGAGCVALTGSDAGNVSIKPASSFTRVSKSTPAASWGSAAFWSIGAGLNFSTN